MIMFTIQYVLEQWILRRQTPNAERPTDTSAASAVVAATFECEMSHSAFGSEFK